MSLKPHAAIKSVDVCASVEQVKCSAEIYFLLDVPTSNNGGDGEVTARTFTITQADVQTNNNESFIRLTHFLLTDLLDVTVINNVNEIVSLNVEVDINYVYLKNLDRVPIVGVWRVLVERK